MTNKDRIDYCDKQYKVNQSLFLKTKKKKDKAIYLNTMLEFIKQKKKWMAIESKEIKKNQLKLF